jgi:hypothetical protein
MGCKTSLCVRAAAAAAAAAAAIARQALTYIQVVPTPRMTSHRFLLLHDMEAHTHASCLVSGDTGLPTRPRRAPTALLRNILELCW